MQRATRLRHVCTGTGLTPAASAPGLRYDRYVRVKAYELLRWMAQAHHIEHNVLPTAGALPSACAPLKGLLRVVLIRFQASNPAATATSGHGCQGMRAFRMLPL